MLSYPREKLCSILFLIFAARCWAPPLPASSILLPCACLTFLYSESQNYVEMEIQNGDGLRTQMLQLHPWESSQCSQSRGSAADSGCQKVLGKIHPLPTQSSGAARDLTPISARISLITGNRRKRGKNVRQSVVLQHFTGVAALSWQTFLGIGDNNNENLRKNLIWARQQQPHSFSLWSL